MKLSHLLLFFFICCSFIIVFVTTVAVIRVSTETLYREKSELLTVKSNQIADRVSDNFDALQKQLQLVETSPAMQSILLKDDLTDFYTRGENRNWQFMRPNILEPIVKTSNGTISLFYVSSQTHGQNYSSNDTSYVDGRTRVWFKEALKSPDFHYTSYLSYTGKQIDVTISKAIYDNGTLLGVVAADISTATIFQEINEASVDSTFFVMAVDTTGTILFHPDSKYLLKSPDSDILPDDLKALINRFAAENMTDPTEFNLNNQDFTLVSKKIQNSGWSVILGLKSSVIQAQIDNLIYLIIAINVVIFTLLSIVILKFVPKILKPLENLSEQMKSIANGSYHDIKPITLKSTREIQDLIFWFNKFSLTMKDLMIQSVNTSDTFRNFSFKLSHGVQRLNTEMVNQRSAVSKASVALETISNLNYGLNERVVEINSSLNNQKKLSDLQIGDIQTVKKSFADIEERISQIADGFLRLEKRFADMTTILNLLQSINRKIRIIGFNATLESHASGEVGVRFARVADEIRRLSDTIEESISDATDLVRTIQSESQDLSQNSVYRATEIQNDLKTYHAFLNNATSINRSLNQIITNILSVTDELSSQRDGLSDFITIENMTIKSLQQVEDIRSEVDSISVELFNLANKKG